MRTIEDILVEGTTQLSPVEHVRIHGPDWPDWTDDQNQEGVIPVYQPGQLYLTRVNGDVYGVFCMVHPKIYVCRYVGDAYPVVVATEESQDASATMRKVMEGFVSYLVRWSL